MSQTAQVYLIKLKKTNYRPTVYLSAVGFFIGGFTMNRFQQREQAFYLIFESQFDANKDSDVLSVYAEYIQEVGEYAKELYLGVMDKEDELESIISQFSNGWKISRIPKVNLSLLKLALYEMIYVDSVPDSVAVNEAVELAKKYSGKEDSSFINGILGAYSRSKD